MKINQSFIASVNNRESNTADYDKDLFELETEDFDKAIEILEKFNKRTKVKEWKLAKKAFVAGNYSDFRYLKWWINSLRQDACGRADTYTRREINETIEKVFGVYETYQSLWISVFQAPINSYLQNKEILEHHKQHLARSEARYKLLEEFLSTGVDISNISYDDMKVLSDKLYPQTKDD